MSQEIYAGFAKRLVQLCDEKKLPERGRQAELARVCNIKPSSVSKWFHAISLPDAANLIAIADWGKTTVDWLLTGRGQKEMAQVVELQPGFTLTWVNAEEDSVLCEYRQCTAPSKRLIRNMLNQAEKDPAMIRAVGGA
jgi:transcriptional regulator with XRE-family HTH domain